MSSGVSDVENPISDPSFHDHPPHLPEQSVDVHRAPSSQSAVHFRRYNLPTSFGVPSVEDYINVGVIGKTVFQGSVQERITTRNDKEEPPHRWSLL